MSDVNRYTVIDHVEYGACAIPASDGELVAYSSYDSLRHERDAALEALRECRPWLLTPGYSTERDAIVARIDAVILKGNP